jgi:hypothetical protein
MTDINFIDGQALTPASFGESDPRTGEWKAKRYSGSYGNNGVYLSFANNASTTTLGLDDGTGLAGSGAGSNDWTLVNHSLSIGANFDSHTDVPGVGAPVTNDIGGVVRGNYAVFNPLNANGVTTISNGGLTVTASADWGGGVSSIPLPKTGKYYVEFTNNSTASNGAQFELGFIPSRISRPGYTHGTGVYNMLFNNNFWVSKNGTYTSSVGGGVASSLHQFAIDCDNNKIWYGRNNAWYSDTVTTNGNPLTGANPTFTELDILNTDYLIAATVIGNTLNANFGQRPFVYAPPAGFKSLCTTNLPEPVVKNSKQQFDVKLWNGNSASQSIGNTARQRDNYQISRSLRFNSADQHYLVRNPASSSNTQTWTWSGWVKKCSNGSRMAFFSAGGGSALTTNWLAFDTDDTLALSVADGTHFVKSSTRFRDINSWYHVVIVYNSQNILAANRVLMYVNGTQITSFASANYPSLNYSGSINNSTFPHYIGLRASYGDSYLNGYMTEINFVDGQALTVDSFGVFDVDGSWQAKRYTGTYGTNGYYLDFSDNSNTTATTLGKDRVGSNNWTPTNISVTAGAGNDSMVDVPTNWGGDDTDSGGEVRGNYCTWDPTYVRTGVDGTPMTLSNGNLQADDPGSASFNGGMNATTEIFSGKWYWEITNRTATSFQPAVGIAFFKRDSIATDGIEYVPWQTRISSKLNQSITNLQTGLVNTAINDVVGVALDADNKTITFYKNNTIIGVTQSYAQFQPPSSESVFPSVFTANQQSTSAIANFGQRPFAYTPPAGFKSINTKNLNEQSPFLNGPDLVWIKRRNASSQHVLTDTVRGADRELFSTTLTLEQSNTGQFLQEFTSNGFVLGASQSGTGDANISGGRYAGFCWNAGSRTVPNADGTLASEVRVNYDAGFSIVSYRGNGVEGATVGHGLGRTPKFTIIKTRSNTAESGWQVWSHLSTTSLTAPIFTPQTFNVGSKSGGVAQLNASSAFGTYGMDAQTNANGGSYIAYCWTEVEGFSKFGTFTGNGAFDGPFINTGFRPAWIMIRRTDSTSNWTIFDVATNRLFNYGTQAANRFSANTTDAEDQSSSVQIDIVSNGFKNRGNGSFVAFLNASGGTYFYAAFAEMPFKYSLAR